MIIEEVFAKSERQLDDIFAEMRAKYEASISEAFKHDPAYVADIMADYDDHAAVERLNVREWSERTIMEMVGLDRLPGVAVH